MCLKHNIERHHTTWPKLVEIERIQGERTPRMMYRAALTTSIAAVFTELALAWTSALNLPAAARAIASRSGPTSCRLSQAGHHIYHVGQILFAFNCMVPHVSPLTFVSVKESELDIQDRIVYCVKAKHQKEIHIRAISCDFTYRACKGTLPGASITRHDDFWVRGRENVSISVHSLCLINFPSSLLVSGQTRVHNEH